MKELIHWLNRLYVHYFLRANPAAKCPACGIRQKHEMLYRPEYKALIHHCGLCQAIWGELPVAPPEKWLVNPIAVQEQDDGPVHARREPMRKVS